MPIDDSLGDPFRATGHDPLATPLPSHDELLADLRELRLKGLIRLRQLGLPALTRAMREVHGAGVPEPSGVERLLRDAVAELGDEEPGLAAQYLFGLIQGTIGRSPSDLRERAAREFGLSSETFRKKQERQILERIADEILMLCRPGRTGVTAIQPQSPRTVGSCTTWSESPAGSTPWAAASTSRATAPTR
jgi:hypothetical protein